MQDGRGLVKRFQRIDDSQKRDRRVLNEPRYWNTYSHVVSLVVRLPDLAAMAFVGLGAVCLRRDLGFRTTRRSVPLCPGRPPPRHPSLSRAALPGPRLPSCSTVLAKIGPFSLIARLLSLALIVCPFDRLRSRNLGPSHPSLGIVLLGSLTL